MSYEHGFQSVFYRAGTACHCLYLLMPKGATYKTQHYLPKYVNIKNMIPIARIPSLCLVCFSKRNGEGNSITEIEKYHK